MIDRYSLRRGEKMYGDGNMTVQRVQDSLIMKRLKRRKKMFSSKYFILGRQVVSQKISIELLENKLFAIEIFDALERFCNKDWGEMGEEDKAANEQALVEGNRIMGAYQTCKGKIWIITEADRLATTVLFPNEY